MGDLTVTYARGRYLIGAKRIPIEIDGEPCGMIDCNESRTFHLPDGKHLIEFRHMLSTTKVRLSLSGEDSFTVSWDRTMGGLQITKEFEGDKFFDRRGWKYIAIYVAVIAIYSLIFTLGAEGVIPHTYVLAGHFILVAFLLLIVIYLFRKMSRTVIWGKDEK